MLRPGMVYEFVPKVSSQGPAFVGIVVKVEKEDVERWLNPTYHVIAPDGSLRKLFHNQWRATYLHDPCKIEHSRI